MSENRIKGPLVLDSVAEVLYVVGCLALALSDDSSVGHEAPLQKLLDKALDVVDEDSLDDYQLQLYKLARAKATKDV
jgi:hypothetical protein